MIRMLVIDDDARLRRLVKRVFCEPDYAVSEAENGLAGVECYRSLRHDVVITDVLMEVQEGVKTILELRALTPSLPILAISGGWQYDRIDLLSLVRRLGATDTLSKPFTATELRAAVARCLRASPAEGGPGKPASSQLH